LDSVPPSPESLDGFISTFSNENRRQALENPYIKRVSERQLNSRQIRDCSDLRHCNLDYKLLNAV